MCHSYEEGHYITKLDRTVLDKVYVNHPWFDYILRNFFFLLRGFKRNFTLVIVNYKKKKLIMVNLNFLFYGNLGYLDP